MTAVSENIVKIYIEIVSSFSTENSGRWEARSAKMHVAKDADWSYSKEHLRLCRVAIVPLPY